MYELRSFYDDDNIARTIEMNNDASVTLPHLRGHIHREQINMYDWLFTIGELVHKQAPGIGTEKDTLHPMMKLVKTGLILPSTCKRS